MTRVTVSEARGAFSELINKVAYGGERTVIERRGKTVAAVVSIEDLELLERLEDHMDVEAAREALKERGAVPWAELKAALGL